MLQKVCKYKINFRYTKWLPISLNKTTKHTYYPLHSINPKLSITLISRHITTRAPRKGEKNASQSQANEAYTPGAARGGQTQKHINHARGSRLAIFAVGFRARAVRGFGVSAPTVRLSAISVRAQLIAPPARYRKARSPAARWN